MWQLIRPRLPLISKAANTKSSWFKFLKLERALATLLPSFCNCISWVFSLRSTAVLSGALQSGEAAKARANDGGVPVSSQFHCPRPPSTTFACLRARPKPPRHADYWVFKFDDFLSGALQSGEAAKARVNDGRVPISSHFHCSRPPSTTFARLRARPKPPCYADYWV